MLDRLSVPRRALDFGDYVDILRRNFRWIIAPAFAGLVISTVVAYFMQDTFVSQAMIRMVPQQISPELVANMSSEDVIDRVNGMAQMIESRTTLTTIINSYGLYKQELKSEPISDVIEMMKTKAISIRPLVGLTNDTTGKTIPAMQVSFSYRDRNMAQRVCADLVSRFMNLSSETNAAIQVSNTDFMKDQFDDAKRNLDAIEQKLADYREKHAGQLPEEMQTNIQEMTALQQQMSALSDASSRNNERRMMLDSELHIAKDRLAALRTTTSQTQALNLKVSELDKQISELETRIASMHDRYTESFPDLQAAKDQLVVLKRERDDALKEKPSKPDSDKDNPLLSKERLDAQSAVDQIQAQMRANGVEAQQIQQRMGSVGNSLRVYQTRLENTPAGEKDYGDLLRDHELAKTRYEQLQVKLEKASASMEMERRKQGETLELLDSASLPTSPTAPKRYLIIPIGAVVGLVLGVVLVAIREVKDTSLKNLKDARLYTQLSILGSIPLLENDVVVQRRKQVMWVGWATATIVGIAMVAGSIAHYYLNQ